jgi:hypothetical protein
MRGLLYDGQHLFAKVGKEDKDGEIVMAGDFLHVETIRIYLDPRLMAWRHMVTDLF